MKTEQIGAAAAGVGLLLVVVALIWPSVDDAQSRWSDADAEAYQETVARAHVGAYLEARARSRSSVHGDEPVDPERLQQHREDVETLKKLNARLQDAREQPYRIAGIMKWSGAGLVAVGTVVLLVGRNKTA